MHPDLFTKLEMNIHMDYKLFWLDASYVVDGRTL